MPNHYQIYFLDTSLRIQEGKVYLIGRSVRSDVSLPHGSVSRKHAAIEWMGESFLLRDLQSTNGTFVNSKRITVHTLRPGDRIQIGEFELQYTVEDESESDGIERTMPQMETMQMGMTFEEIAREASKTTKVTEGADKKARYAEPPGKDKLTGCFNRAYFERVIGDEVQISREFEQQMALMLIDVDGFEQINQDHGRDVGEDVLCVVAGVINNAARTNDIVARYEGDKFVVVAPNAASAAAMSMAEQIREQAAERAQKIVDGVSVSVGVAGFTDEVNTAERLVQAAEEALQAAKKNGRNRVESAS